MADVVRLPAEFVAFAKTQPWWAGQEAIAHTLAYDAEVMGDYLIPADRAREVAVPTIILTGGASFPFFRETAEAVAGIIPDARTGVLEAQEHNVDPQVLGAALTEFFAS
jgi:pimeloyl-ACP methyl ester carboxylesterase